MYINELYHAVQKGGEQAEERLFGALLVSFRMFVRRRVADDVSVEEIVQETLSIIAEKHRSITFERSFAAWAYSVLEHVVKRHYRAEHKRRNLFAAEQTQTAGSIGGHIDPELKIRLLDCLQKISRARVRHARILNLHHQGYSVKEICTRLRITTNNLYTILSRARVMLHRCLETGEIS